MFSLWHPGRSIASRLCLPPGENGPVGHAAAAGRISVGPVRGPKSGPRGALAWLLTRPKIWATWGSPVAVDEAQNLGHVGPSRGRGRCPKIWAMWGLCVAVGYGPNHTKRFVKTAHADIEAAKVCLPAAGKLVCLRVQFARVCIHLPAPRQEVCAQVQIPRVCIHLAGPGKRYVYKCKLPRCVYTYPGLKTR